MREELQVEIRDIHRKLGSTFVYVTHDQGEALTMSDRLVVMGNARLAQEGSPREVYDRPNSPFVASFLGDANLLPAMTLTSLGEMQDLEIAGGFVASLPRRAATPFLPQTAVMLLIRPEDLRLCDGRGGGRDIEVLPATLVDIMFFGNSAKLSVRVGDTPLSLLAHPGEMAGLAPGASVHVAWDRARAHVLRLEGSA